MARKTKTLVIDKEGRDKGKVFLLKEQSAYDAEKWALRLVEAGQKVGIDIPPHIANSGVAALQMMGIFIFASISATEREPLLDQLFDCITIIRDPSHPAMSFPLIRTGEDQDIEEIATLWTLQNEVIMLHGNFSPDESPSISISDPPQSVISKNTSTSPRSSARSSPRKAPRL